MVTATIIIKVICQASPKYNNYPYRGGRGRETEQLAEADPN